MRKLKVTALFAGIGGVELGLSREGHETLLLCEWDASAQSVLRDRFPEIPLVGDVRELERLPEGTELLTAGFPCQDLSYAGKGAGLQGERSGLWFEFARIIRELRPRFVVVENVSALLGRGLGRVLGDLAESGYDAKWDCIPAQSVGAPHRRDRLFVVAWRIPDTERDGIRDKPKRGQGAAQEAHGGDAEPLHLGASVGHPSSLQSDAGEYYTKRSSEGTRWRSLWSW